MDCSAEAFDGASHIDRRRELILLPSLKAHLGPSGRLVLTRKFLNGVKQYAKSWPGPVAVLVAVHDTPTSDLDHFEIPQDYDGYSVEIRPQRIGDLRDRIKDAAAVLGFLSPFELETARLCHETGVPLIFTSEYSPTTEKQIIDADTRNPLLRIRRKIWVHQAEKKRQSALKLAAGLQCSGSPTFDLYGKVHSEALLFFDSRVTEDAVISERELQAKQAALLRGDPLRLVFGGRLIPMKGVSDLPEVALGLKRRGVPFTLEIYGDGPLKGVLAEEIAARGLGAEVALRGAVDFEAEWVPMLKARTDLFVCCHPQGDPSSSYPEVMSCGVPIAGYANEAFEGIVRHSGSGWLSPVGRPDQLAACVARLSKNRAEIAAAARLARPFALKHAFENTFARRVDHLVRLSRLG
jgi:colanic acid/amylovoran biosynthesis glycosyltransferase